MSMNGDEMHETQQTLAQQTQPNTTDMNIARLIEAFTADSKANRENTSLILTKMEERLHQAEERNKLADERNALAEEKHQADRQQLVDKLAELTIAAATSNNASNVILTSAAKFQHILSEFR